MVLVSDRAPRPDELARDADGPAITSLYNYNSETETAVYTVHCDACGWHVVRYGSRGRDAARKNHTRGGDRCDRGDVVTTDAEWTVGEWLAYAERNEWPDRYADGGVR